MKISYENKNDRTTLEKLCNPPDHLINSVGDDCGGFLDCNGSKLQYN